MKKSRDSLLGEARPCCPGDTCCKTLCSWVRRNWIHVLLLGAAVAAVLAAVLLSLDSCSTDTQNVTVTEATQTLFMKPLTVVTLIDASGSMRNDNKWTDAKKAIPKLNNALYAAMNDRSDENNKLRTGLVKWANQASIESSITNGNESNTEVTNMTMPPNDATYWGPGLCTCYKMIMEDPESAASNKMCILLADGDLAGQPNSPIGGADEEAGCDNPDVQGSRDDCPCDYLWADVAEDGFELETSASITSARFAEQYLRKKNITIFSILVGNNGAERIYSASSCSDLGFEYDNETQRDACPYYMPLDTFAELELKVAGIAEKQKTIATTSRTVITQGSVSEKVSICSLDFLYALGAFLPLLAYIVYRVVVIKKESKAMRGQLYEMIKNKTLSREDNVASVATRLMLPHEFPGDIDYGISYLLFHLPGMIPVSRDGMDKVFGQSTLAL